MRRCIVVSPRLQRMRVEHWSHISPVLALLLRTARHNWRSHSGRMEAPGALDRMATAPCLQGNHKRPFAERQRQLDSHVGDVSWSRMAAAVAVADALEANATRGPVGTCQCCMHAVDVAVPAVDCPKSGAVPMSRARRVHNSGQMRCREAQEVSMRIVGDTARPTVCCVTCQKSVSRRSKRRAGMLKGNVAQND
jgi:hypothetical protein